MVAILSITLVELDLLSKRCLIEVLRKFKILIYCTLILSYETTYTRIKHLLPAEETTLIVYSIDVGAKKAPI